MRLWRFLRRVDGMAWWFLFAGLAVVGLALTGGEARP